MRTRGKNPGHLVKNLLSGGIALTLIILLLTKLHQHYDLLQEQQMSFSPVLFGISLLPLVLSYLFIPSMWCKILESIGVALSYRKAFQIQYLSHLGRYIPGKVWPYVAQSYLAAQTKISIAETLCSNTLLMCLMSLGSLLVFALSFLVWSIYPLPIRSLIALLSLFLVYLLLRMHTLERGTNFILIRVTAIRMPILCKPLSYPYLLTALFLSWSAFAAGLHLMIASFYSIDLYQSIIITGIFAISWLVGYYAFFSPGGLGVQEGVQVYLLTFFFPLPISIVIAFASRLWIIMGDLIIFFLAMASTIHEDQLQESVHGACP